MPKLLLVGNGEQWDPLPILVLSGFGKVNPQWLHLCDCHFDKVSTSKFIIRFEVALPDLGSGRLWGSVYCLHSHAPSRIKYHKAPIQRTIMIGGGDFTICNARRGFAWTLWSAGECVCEATGECNCICSMYLVRNLFF